MTKTIVKIIIVVILTAGLFGIILACGSESTKDSKAIESLKEVLRIKHNKQNCVDNLTALQTEEYLKGVSDYCKSDDEKIKELKSIIDETINGFEYENIDRIIQEKKDEKILNNSGTSAIEKLEGLLMSE